VAGAVANAFDQFDEGADKSTNPFDKFDTPVTTSPVSPEPLSSHPWGHTAAYLGQEALRGGAALLGLPGSVRNLLPSVPGFGEHSVAPEWMRRTLPELITGQPYSPQYAPTVGEVEGGLDALQTKLTGAPPLTPQGQVENFGGAIARGALPTAAAILTGAPAVPAILSAGAGGMASETARQEGASPLIQFGVGALVGAGVGGAAQMTEKFAATVAANNAANKSALELATLRNDAATARITDTAKLRAAQDAEDAAKDAYTTNLDAANTAKSDALAKARLASAQAKSQETLNLRAAQAAESAAQAQHLNNLRTAGSALQDFSRDWLGNTMPAKLSAIWDPVDATIPGDTTVRLDGFKSALQDITKDAGKLQPVADKFTSGLPKEVQGAFNQLLKNNKSGEFDWDDVRTLRTIVGDNLADPRTVRDYGSQNLNHLYGALSGDLHSAAESVGAGDLFASANAESTKLYNFAQGPLAKVIAGKTADVSADPAPETVAARLRAGSSDLAELADQGFPVQGLNDTALEKATAARVATQRGILDARQQRQLDILKLSQTSPSVSNKDLLNASAGRQATQRAIEDANQAREKQIADLVLAQAKAKAPLASSLLGHAGQSIAGLEWGGAVGKLLGYLTGVPGGSELGKIIGGAVPYIGRGVLATPRLAPNAFLGAASPLVPPRPPGSTP
jgi:hypothetical protein